MKGSKEKKRFCNFFCLLLILPILHPQRVNTLYTQIFSSNVISFNINTFFNQSNVIGYQNCSNNFVNFDFLFLQIQFNWK